MSYSERYWQCRDCSWKSDAYSGDMSCKATVVPDEPDASALVEAHAHSCEAGHVTYQGGFNADEGMEIGPSDWLVDALLQMERGEHVERARVFARRARERARRFNAHYLRHT